MFTLCFSTTHHMPLVLVAMEHIHVPMDIRLCTSISWLQVSGKKGGILETNRAGEQTAMISYPWTWLKPCAQYSPLNSHGTYHQFTFLCWTPTLPTVTGTAWPKRQGSGGEGGVERERHFYGENFFCKFYGNTSSWEHSAKAPPRSLKGLFKRGGLKLKLHEFSVCESNSVKWCFSAVVETCTVQYVSC